MSSRSSLDKRLQTLAMEITDEVPIDWSREQAETGAEDRLSAIRLIDDVFRAHHSLESPPDPSTAPLFRWGGLEVLERIAEGGFGEVYLAFDPRLQRTVALKLRRTDAPDTTSPWIEEARLLAKVTHPHVVTVHGAEVHDGRAGIVTELIRGVTLEEWLRQNGPASAAEAALVGVDLCRALAAVHRAGLVHGDVKTANVMREQGGRVVLMDFGSARVGSGAATGTPLYAAPEVLEGNPATEQSDVFAVGALLYRLASGIDPFPASTFAELREKHRSGAPTPLRSLRPDLPSPFVGAVMEALSVAPADRPAGVAGLEGRLSAALPPPVTPVSRRPALWRWRGAMVAAVAVVAAIAIWRLASGPDSRVTVSQSNFVRVANRTDFPLAPHAKLEVGDHVAYRFAADEPLHVYVLNQDATGDMYILFPAPHVDAGNPLAGGRTHRLPGTRAGASFDWIVTSEGGTETFLVVASRQPVALLEAELSRLGAARPDRAPEYAPLSPTTLRRLRGLGGTAPTSDTGPAQADRLAQLATQLQGPLASPDIWVDVVSFGPAR